MNRTLQRNSIIYVCVVLALLPIIVMRDYTPSNELRYLSIADEALRNHNFFAFYNHGEVYADKPPLYFWLLMLCRSIAGGYHMWILSLFSVLPALGTLKVMDSWTKDEMDTEHRSLAVLMLITSAFFLGASIILRMDMLMTFFIVLSLREFWRMYNAEDCQGRSRWLFPVYLFLALFSKGPLGLLIPLCATAAYLVVSKRLKSFFRYWGWRTWGVLAVLCALWFAGIYAEGGQQYLDNILVHQTVGRAVNSFHHKAPFYYYLLHIWYCAAPWSLLAAGVLTVSLRPKFVRSDLQRFFQTVFVSGFVLLSCISAKLQIYILPVLPFFIYLTAMFVSRIGTKRWVRLAISVPSLAFALALPVLLLALSQDEVFAWGGGFIYAAATILSIRGLSALWSLYAQKDTSVEYVIRHLSIGMLLAVFVGGWAMPRINRKMSYGKICTKALEAAAEYKTNDFRTWNLPRTESMDVYLDASVRVIPLDSMPVSGNGKRYILITRKGSVSQLNAASRAVTVGDYAVIPFNENNNDNN